MANYGMGGADGRGADDLKQLVRNQQNNLQQDRRTLGIDADQGRKPQASHTNNASRRELKKQPAFAKFRFTPHLTACDVCVVHRVCSGLDLAKRSRRTKSHTKCTPIAVWKVSVARNLFSPLSGGSSQSVDLSNPRCLLSSSLPNQNKNSDNPI